MKPTQEEMDKFYDDNKELMDNLAIQEDYDKRIVVLQKRLAEAEALLGEIDEYLNHSPSTTIGSKSIFHRQIKAFREKSK